MNVLFPFGHGLSYTEFSYRDIVLDKTAMKDTETLSVQLKVKNTGKRAGKEAVQLYVRDPQSSAARPVRELKGFAKISLDAGEEKTVTFTLDKRAFAYYEVKIHDWYVESGDFIIEAGSSSRDIRLSAHVEVEGTTQIPIFFTQYTSIGELAQTDRGREIMAKMRKEFGNSSVGQNLGPGFEEMVMRAYMDMPLASLVNFGHMKQEDLDKLLASLNGQGSND
jgi:beta-glucosidase